MSEDIYNTVVNDRKSFARFISLLGQDLAADPASWENKTLPDFFEALSRYTEDIQGYYDYAGKEVDADQPNWEPLQICS